MPLNRGQSGTSFGRSSGPALQMNYRLDLCVWFVHFHPGSSSYLKAPQRQTSVKDLQTVGLKETGPKSLQQKPGQNTKCLTRPPPAPPSRSLPQPLQTVRVGAAFGALGTRPSNFAEVCGSPGEVAAARSWQGRLTLAGCVRRGRRSCATLLWGGWDRR